MDILLEDGAPGYRDNRGERPETMTTPVTQFYGGKTVLITGATGSLGKLLLLKLLQCCPDVTKVVLLMRPKYLNQISHRVHHLFEEMAFERLRARENGYLEKIDVMRGDLSQPNLGLSESDVEKLSRDVDIVFHLGSTTMFDDGSLKSAADVNVRALWDLLTIAKQFKKLQAFVHVSSLFANCNKEVLEEKFEEPLVKAKALVDFVSALNSNFSCSKPINLRNWPNNYLFTKSVAEEAIKSHSGHLPVVIVRLPLIVSSVAFPCPGYTDNINSLVGLTMTTYLGLNKSILAKRENLAEIFPIDFAVNVIIAAAWNTARTKSLNFNIEVPKVEEKVPIYNVTTSRTNALTWGLFLKMTSKYTYLHPTKFTLSLPWHFVHANKRVHFLLITVLHYIPGYFCDFINLYLTSKTKFLNARYVGYYSKIDMLSRTFSHFMLNAWDVKVSNLRTLYDQMGESDRELFDFDATNVHWDTYARNYIRGIRRCILKDSDDSLEEAKRENVKRFLYSCAHFVAIIVVFSLILFFIYA